MRGTARNVTSYTDASVTPDLASGFALAGRAVWYPDRHLSEYPAQRGEVEIANVAQQGDTRNPTAAVASLAHFDRPLSTGRVELAAGVTSLYDPRPAKNRSDAMYLVGGHTKLCTGCINTATRPWGPRGDGDLWALY